MRGDGGGADLPCLHHLVLWRAAVGFPPPPGVEQRCSREGLFHLRSKIGQPFSPISTQSLPYLVFPFLSSFNRDITGVRWPPRLSKLEFCGELTQRIEDVALPPTLDHLALLGDFDQPVHAVKWPAGLVTVRFGNRFRQPVAAGIAWPPTLRKVVVGRGYGRLRSSEGGGGGSPAGALEAPVARRPPVMLPSTAVAEAAGDNSRGLPPSCEVVVAPVNDGNDGGDEEEDDGGGGADETEGAGAILLGDGYRGLAVAENGGHGGAGAGGQGGNRSLAVIVVAGGDRGPVDLDEFYADDEGRSQSGWGGDEDGGDWGGLECVDVFGFEDGTWDLGDPCTWSSY